MKNAPGRKAGGVFFNCHNTLFLVGASLLAKAVCGSAEMQLIRRFREQARSHRGIAVR